MAQVDPGHVEMVAGKRASFRVHYRCNGRGWRTQHADCAIAYRGTDARNVERPAEAKKKEQAR